MEQDAGQRVEQSGGPEVERNVGQNAEPDSAPTPVPSAERPQAIDPRSLPVVQRINLLVKALNGARRTNEALANCADGEAMLEVLLQASAKLGLGLSRRDLASTPPIRDWIWWKNKQALLTIGDDRPRYQQDGRNPGPDPAQAGAVSPGQKGGEQQPRRRFLGLF